jgi:hypothetical protein
LFGDISTYAYARENPLVFRDVHGLTAAIPVPWSWAGVGETISGWGTAIGEALAGGSTAAASAVGVVGLLYPSPMGYAACENEGPGACNRQYSKAKPDREQKPPNCPVGTRPIDQWGLSKDDIHTIKNGINAGPKDWVGVDPEGNVWTNEDGEASDQGPMDNYLP